MNRAIRVTSSVIASIAVPLGDEVTLIALHEERGFLEPWALALLAVVLNPFTGFVFLARQFPSRALVLSCAYFPAMWIFLLYVGYITALMYGHS